VLRMLGVTIAVHAIGRTVEAAEALRELIDKHADRGAFQIAGAYAFAGDADHAFAWLDRADAQGDPGLVEIKAEILLRNIHGDPRWPRMIEKLGLAG